MGPGIRALVFLGFFVIAAAARADDAAASTAAEMFNGKDLSGWDGAPGWWTVEDGALTSESTDAKKCLKPNYLIWTGGQPADFQLDCEFKLSANGNSGIQIRSERRPDHDTFGYQADMTGDGKLVGFLYHHRHGLVAERGTRVSLDAGGKRTVEVMADSKDLLRHYKPEQWNQYRIRCEGDKISVWLNGELMCDIVDHSARAASPTGFIGLQMHPGPPMKVQFRKLLLTPLSGTSAPQPSSNP